MLLCTYLFPVLHIYTDVGNGICKSAIPQGSRALEITWVYTLFNSYPSCFTPLKYEALLISFCITECACFLKSECLMELWFEPSLWFLLCSNVLLCQNGMKASDSTQTASGGVVCVVMAEGGWCVFFTF